MLENSKIKNSELFLSDSVIISQSLLSEILATINQMDNFSLKKEFPRNLELANLMNDISQFVEITSLLSKLLTDNKKYRDEVRQSHINLLFILKGIGLAQQKQDIVALEELIKYELKDNLTMWKIDLLPQTKRFLNT